MIPRNEGGQVSVFGKGNKTRIVLIPPPVWELVSQLKKDYGPDEPVFRSRQRGKTGYIWVVSRYGELLKMRQKG